MSDTIPQSFPPPAPAATLLQRSPGHAVMTHWLELVRSHRGRGFEGLPEEGRSWHDGALGELLVGHELALLPPGWHVLHAVPAGSAGADIDHLVIGPPGVFVINTKRHPDAVIKLGTNVIWINGRQQNHYQSNIRKRCDQVRLVLFRATGEQPPVHPMLVFAQARRLAHHGDQFVMSAAAHDLVRFLISLPACLSSDQTLDLVQAAARPSTWGASDQVLLEPDPTFDFLALSSGAPRPSPRRPSRPGPRIRPRRTSAPRRRKSSIASKLEQLILTVIGLAIGLPIAMAVITAVLNSWAHLLLTK
jgi:hypothetical protein